MFVDTLRYIRLRRSGFLFIGCEQTIAGAIRVRSCVFLRNRSHLSGASIPQLSAREAPLNIQNGGAVHKTILSFSMVMLLSSALFAQRAGSRATTGTTTTTNSGSCTSGSSTSTASPTGSASQRTQALNTVSLAGTRSKAEALIEGVNVIRASRSASSGTPSSSVKLPSTVVPFR